MKMNTIKKSGGVLQHTHRFETGKFQTTEARWMNGREQLQLTTAVSVWRTDTIHTYQRTGRCSALESFARHVGKPGSSLARWAETRRCARWELVDAGQEPTYEVQLTEDVVKTLSKEEGYEWLKSNGLSSGLTIERLVLPLEGPSAA